MSDAVETSLDLFSRNVNCLQMIKKHPRDALGRYADTCRRTRFTP
jgi:hypothetical protein